MIELNRSRSRQMGRAVLSGLLALAFCYLVIFVELPYYVFQPGTAENIRGMVTVGAEAGNPESGAVLLTTVGVTRANLLKLVEAQFRYYDVRKIADVRQEGETDEEYGERQRSVMLTSQSNAVQAAYREAGIPYRLEVAGVTVLRTYEEYPSHGVLATGDVLLAVDGISVKSGEALTQAFAKKQAGDTVRIRYRRGSAEMEAEILLKPLPKSGGGSADGVGIGAVTADMQVVRPDKPEKRVAIEAGDIGGPSAGFVFALEAYSRLTPGDLTKGYRIAGTGTIDPQGRIGVIGGIRHKVVAADRQGVDIFFTPKDWQPREGDPSALPVPNATEAAEQAKKIRSDMRVVPVGTLAEAVRYLEKLPPKETPKEAGN